MDANTAIEMLEMSDLLGCDGLMQPSRDCLYASGSATQLLHLAVKHGLDEGFLMAGLGALKAGRLGESWDAQEDSGSGGEG